MSITDISIIPPIIAHRGASFYAPENTLAAFLKAKQLGLKWVEFDVMLTLNGEPILIHDETLMRTTNGKGCVMDYPYSYLKTLDAGSWFDPIYSDEKIPTLEETLLLLSQEKMAANIEIKAKKEYEIQTVEQVIQVILQNNYHEKMPLLISSFSPNILKKVRERFSKANLACLMHEWHEDWQIICDELNVASVNVNQHILNLDRASAIKQTKRLLLSYTVNTPLRAKELFSLGVDAIFSDCPPKMQKVMH